MPTCSEYAMESLKEYGLIKELIYQLKELENVTHGEVTDMTLYPQRWKKNKYE
jgi:putative component of membrane protein insertase Oxa1/YidC/SpoIIIJ protein YidD